MRLSFLLATMALSATLASAAAVTVNCGSIQTFANATGSTSVSCPSFNTAVGAPTPFTTLNSVTLNYYADYGFGTAATNNIAVTFTVGAPAGVTWSTASRTVNVTGTLNSTTFVPPIPVPNAATAGVTLANFASAFNVGIASTPVSGGAASSSGLVTITYDYNLVPEPSTWGLIGAGLAAIGLVRRRK